MQPKVEMTVDRLWEPDVEGSCPEGPLSSPACPPGVKSGIIGGLDRDPLLAVV